MPRFFNSDENKNCIVARAAESVEAVNENDRDAFLLILNKADHSVEFVTFIGLRAFISTTKET